MAGDIRWREVDGVGFPIGEFIPSEADKEADRLVFVPKVRTVGNFEFADTEIGRVIKAFSVRKT